MQEFTVTVVPSVDGGRVGAPPYEFRQVASNVATAAHGALGQFMDGVGRELPYHTLVVTIAPASAEDAGGTEAVGLKAEDLYELAKGYLETFVILDCGCSFLSAMAENSDRSWNNYWRIKEYLTEGQKRELLVDVDASFERNWGDEWHAYKFMFCDRGFPAADVDRVVRLARSIPEDRWGHVSDHGYSSDLQASLKSAVEGQASGARRDWRLGGF